MQKENPVLAKSYAFALRVVKLYVYLKAEKIYPLADQVLRSGTSIGANIEEALGGSSRKDFKAKLDISYKEALETQYWLKLLRDSLLLNNKIANSLITDCEEIIKLLTAIIKTLKSSNDTPAKNY